MAWWNWALVLWATGATAGAAGLAVVLARRAERQEERRPESGDLGWLLDEGTGRPATPDAEPPRTTTPLVLLTRLRSAVPGRSR